MSKVVNISGQKDFNEKILNSKTPVLVDFWAPWCGPCLFMAPILDEISEELGDSLTIAKVNTEEGENQILAMVFGIRSIPNMKLFKNGKITKEFIGAKPIEIFKKELQENLTS